jgi:hypothetical protein
MTQLKEKRIQDYTDLELSKMRRADVLALGHKSINLGLLNHRVHRGWDLREAATTPKITDPRPAKSHPYKKFTDEFYSNRNKEKAKEREKDWGK